MISATDFRVRKIGQCIECLTFITVEGPAYLSGAADPAPLADQRRATKQVALNGNFVKAVHSAFRINSAQMQSIRENLKLHSLFHQPGTTISSMLPSNIPLSMCRGNITTGSNQRPLSCSPSTHNIHRVGPEARRVGRIWGYRWVWRATIGPSLTDQPLFQRPAVHDGVVGGVSGWVELSRSDRPGAPQMPEMSDMVG